MTILSSGAGALGLQDAGSNPSSSVLLDTGYNSLSLAADSSFGMFRRIFESEPGFSSYFTQQVVDGTAYYFRRNSTGASHDGYVSHSNGSGYNASIFTTAYSYMASSPSYGDWDSTDLAINSSSNSSVGSLSNSTYADASGTVRQINDFGFIKNTNNYSGGSWTQDRGNLIWFSLDGNVSNNNNAFYQITAYDNSGNGITVTRSGASYDYDGVQSVWTWHNNSDAIMDFGNVITAATRLYIIQAGTTSFNNGIAEEMGGNDSSNVTASHYYKGGIYHNTTGIPVTGNPLPFSDFFGKTFTPNQLHNTTFVAGYANIYGYVNSGYNQTFGSMTDNTFNLSDGKAVKIETLQNMTQGTMYFILKPQSGSMTFTNGGWTTLKIWRNQSNNSGTPTLTLNRTSMTYSASNNGTTSAQATYYLSGSYPVSTYFGTSTTNCYLEID